MILCGDLNINLYNPYKLNSINSFISLLTRYNFYSLINLPTKFNPNNRITEFALLDQIWTNFIPLMPKSGVIEETITDHLPIFSFFNVKAPCGETISSYRIFF